MRYIRTLWMIARPRTLLLVVLHGVLAYLFLTGSQPNWWLVLLAFISMVSAYMHAVAVNDISDEAVDKLNKKFLTKDNDRPLLQSTLSSRGLWILSWGIVAVWLVAGFAISWLSFVAALILCALNFIYSLPPIRLSSRGIFAQLLLPIMYVVYPFFLAGQVAGEQTMTLWMLCFALYIVFAGRLFLKDIRDEAGDKKEGKRTFLVRHGMKTNLIVSYVFIASGLIAFGTALSFKMVSLFVLSVCIVAVPLLAFIFHRLYTQKKLEIQLLDVAIIGRIVSACVFIGLISVAVIYTQLSMFQALVAQVLAVAIFIFGSITLQEEKRRAN